MKIKKENILDYLNKHKIQYTIIGKTIDYYEISSMFQVVNEGFYFFVAGIIPKTLKNSLIITDNDSIVSNCNSIILINQDPQRLFYSIIDYYFKEISTSVISNTAQIHQDAILGKNIQIDDFCVIGKCKINDFSIIKSHCVIEDNTVIGKNTVIEAYSHIGARGMAWVWNNEQTKKIILPQLGGVKIGNNCILGSNTIVVRGSLNENTIIGNNTLIAPGCRLGHGTQIGEFVHFANNIATGGNTVIGDYSFIGSSVTFRPKTILHHNTIVGAGAVVVKNTTGTNMTLVGVPAKEYITKKNPAGMPKPKK